MTIMILARNAVAGITGDLLGSAVLREQSGAIGSALMERKNICPTCRQPLSPRRETMSWISSADQLVAAMRIPPSPSYIPHLGGNARDIYEGYENGRATGRFHLTYMVGAEVRREAIDEALRRGLIRLKHVDCNGYWCL